MMLRREFIEKIGMLSMSVIAQPQFFINSKDYWASVRKEFSIADKNATYLNLNSGSAGVMPDIVIKAVHELHHFMNNIPPYQALELWTEERIKIKQELAELIGCQSSEIAFQRNTTEALNHIIAGIPLFQDDEVIASTTDYPFALNALQTKCNQTKATLIQIEHEHNISEDEIIDAYTKAISSKTKYIHLTHMKHNSARIMPVKRITQLAHDNNIKVILDGAHSFGHFDYNLADLGCDYWATSLHKWLMAPHGTGLIFIKEKHIEETGGPICSYKNVTASISKFEQIGTHAYFNETGIKFALDYHKKIGIHRKETRLRELTNYWREALSENIDIEFYTPSVPTMHGGICSFYIPNNKIGLICNRLKTDYQIIVKKTGYNNKPLIRVASNIYTSKKDLDRFIRAIHSILQS